MSQPSSQTSSFRRDESGAVILETALMLTILLMLMFGIFDIGRVMYTMNSLTSAAREGARAGAVIPSTGCATFGATVKTVVENRFTPFGGSALADSNITVSSGGSTLSNTCPASQTGSVRVAITYPFSWLTPLPRLVNWGSSTTKNVNVAAEYKYEM